VRDDLLGIEDYFGSYLPALISRYLEERTIPGMEGTNFTLQLTIKGERSLVYGIAIKDAREINVFPGGIDNPMLEAIFPEDFVRPLVETVSSFTGKRQYDAVASAKGSVRLEMEMPGGWTLPVTIVFNGASRPSVTIAASSGDFAKMATGELKGPTAFMQGKIKLEGDMSFALALANLLP
jgi:predicted lipid carrier protein YhbT